MTTKRFSTAALLSCSTGILMPDETVEHPIDNLYGVLGRMTGRSLMTHELPQAMDLARDDLTRQFPWLPTAAPGPGDLGRDEYLQLLLAFIEDLSGQHGAEHDVAPMADLPMADVNPLAGLVERYGADKVVAISLEG